MPYQTVVVAVLVVATATILYLLANREPAKVRTAKEPAYSYGGNNSQSTSPNTSYKDWDRCDDNKRRSKHSKPICIICYDDLTEGIRTLPCQHKFHEKCINKWLSEKENQNQACPLCRKRVL